MEKKIKCLSICKSSFPLGTCTVSKANGFQCSAHGPHQAFFSARQGQASLKKGSSLSLISSPFLPVYYFASKAKRGLEAAAPPQACSAHDRVSLQRSRSWQGQLFGHHKEKWAQLSSWCLLPLSQKVSNVQLAGTKRLGTTAQKELIKYRENPIQIQDGRLLNVLAVIFCSFTAASCLSWGRNNP